MVKSFLILISFSIFLYSSQQIVLVVSNDFNTSKAKLECFEDGKIIFKSIEVNLGRNGLGWGRGLIEFKHQTSEPIKKEGDKKAPIGVFKLTSVFGYKQSQNLHMPYLHATKNLICVDDSNSKNYNQIIHMPKVQPKSFEFMKRDDKQYEIGVVVQHNKNALALKGSCIFLHVYKSKDAGTAGCTSMKFDDMKKISTWLDIDKNPILIQIPKSSISEILKLYPELRSSEILKED